MRNLVSLGCRPEKLFHLPNAIDLTQFLLPGFRNGERITILGVGRFVPPKRFDRFLRILALLRQSCSLPFKALIAGDGPLRPDLERLARNSGLLSGTVEFCGNVPDVRSLYSQAHILLLTSDHEGTPNVVLEAMACGLPVVATAVGDVPELVEHGLTGYVIGTDDEEGAARHLLELMQHAGKREAMGRRARSFIQEHHALEALPGHLARLYSERLA
jgi:glycosyltransferase involved in cell wall biosynthesis